MSAGSYEDSIASLEALYRLPLIPARITGLRRVRRLLAALGDPQTAFRAVHVAGSSGKGSTTTMIGAALHASGYGTGLFRSPHLNHYTERISIGEVDISRDEWVRVFNIVWPHVERLRSAPSDTGNLGRPTLFEVLFCMACVHFAESGVQWAAIETGLGGRLDPTNVLAPDVAVVTNISLEHTHVLGRTEREIAAEKAAIIKPGAHAVTAATNGDALEVIVHRASLLGVPLARVGPDPKLSHALYVPPVLAGDPDVAVRVTGEGLDGQEIELRPKGGSPVSFHLASLGTFQIVNAATAYLAILALRERAVSVDIDIAAHAIGNAQAPARLEVVSRDPLIILDGAHNPDAAQTLADSLDRALPCSKLVIVFASMNDKDVRTMARYLARHASRVIATRAPGTDRSANPRRIADHFAAQGVESTVVEDPAAALECALESARGAPVVVTGSMYLVGALRARFTGRES